MDSLIDKVSLRETLKSFIPGFYLVVFLIPIIEQRELLKAVDASAPDIYSILLLIIFTALFGILISAIDLPKHFWLFKNILPTEKLIKEFGFQLNIYNSYFQFYNNEISSEDRDITEKYTNYYHFCFNMGVVSTILLIVHLLIDTNSFRDSYAFPITLILLTSIIGVLFLLYGKKKIKHRFERNFQKYKNSCYYNKLKDT